MNKFIEGLKLFLEKIDSYRDEILFVFIKPYWPSKITPNKITTVRIIIGVLLFILLFFFKIEDKILIVSLFFFGVLTDLLDGSVARGKNMVTELGAMLDPVADRIIIITIAVYSLFEAHRWLLLVLLLIEVANTFVSIYYKTKKVYLESNIFGKTKMVMQSLVFAAILFFWPNPPHRFFIDILWVSVAFALLNIFYKILEIR
ncbi:MAG: CDP-alcohol phosphatidyltransferase family protein, partial [Candidatus Staskawiczbacteria bacterium]|nr:CDP-alcohol phosphatidyltransferase family protein [Candidatus Staskawiczbacteria bacterium]